jgi:glyoxylase-like metal-dependent hydrolase (beta-lactamase superfamily II)
VSGATDRLPVAEDWWKLEDAGDGVTRLIERHIDLLLESNVWHVRGRDRDLVIDTGNGVGALRPAIDALTAGRPVISVVTHGHFDHVGGLHEFEDRRGHADDADEVRKPFAMRLHSADFPEGAVEMYTYYGYPVPEVIVRALPSSDFDADAWSSPGADLTAAVNDGDVIDLGDRTFEILHVPGHTPGSVALWEPATGLLFTGDMLYVGAKLSFDDPVASAASLTRLRALPVRRVHAGHDRSVDHDEFLRVIDVELRSLGGRARSI